MLSYLRLTASGQDKGRVRSEEMAGCRSASRGSGAKERGPEPGPPLRNSESSVPRRGRAPGCPWPPTGREGGGCGRFSLPRRASPSRRGALPRFGRGRLPVRKSCLPLTENIAHESKEPEWRGARQVRGEEAREKPLPSAHGPLRSPGPAPARR